MQGSNTLTGGAGSDLFEIGPGIGNDIITDFPVGEDTLGLAQATVIAWTAADTNGDGTNDSMKLVNFSFFEDLLDLPKANTGRSPMSRWCSPPATVTIAAA